MKYKVDNNYFIILFFICYFLTGTFIVGDYSITPDEPLHRINGFISLKYIFDFLNLNVDLSRHVNNIPSLHEDWRKTYGVIFDLPLAYLEFFFNIENKNNVYLMRHYFTFSIFFIACIYFYFFIKKNVDYQILAFIGVLMLITTPRIFSHSFYNSKDIIFLSLMIIAAFYSLQVIKNFSIKNIVLSCLFCACATNIRVIGFYLPLLTFFFYYFKNKRSSEIKTHYFFVLYFLLYFSFLYLIWPFLWENPITNFIVVFTESMNYPAWWSFKIFYLGKFINPENLPWHYFFVWFSFTTPIVFLLLIVSSLVIFLKKYFNHFIKIDFNKDISLWSSDLQMTNLYIFLVFFIPIFFVVCLNSTLYNGWRHLFFVYPFLIFLSIQTINSINKKYIKNYFKFFILVMGIQFFFNCLFILKTHPVQNVYFNIFAKEFAMKKLPIDYWGLGNKNSIDILIKKNKNIFLNISTASYSDLNNIFLSENEAGKYSKNLSFNGTSKELRIKSNYIFTNFYYDRDPKNVEKYKIPDSFSSYYKFTINGITVNEIFKRIK